MVERNRSRRAFLKSGSALVAAGVLAGCQSGDGTTTGTPTDTTTDGTTESTTAQTTDSSYTVSMEPVGDVAFEEVPETWLPYTADYADMGVALGQADGLAGIGVPSRYGTHHYAELDGVSVDTESLTTLYQDGTGKEVFYSVDADVHVIDPNFMVNRLQWEEADVEEISSGVAPFYGNTIFTQVYDWHDYEYYSLYEAFEKLAALFQERGRYEAFKSYHDEVVADVQSRLPSETPEIALLYPAGVPPDSFYPYLVGEGTASKQWRDLGVDDALAEAGVTDAQAGGATVDYETLLDIDPDAIAVRLSGNISDAYFQENIVKPMQEDEVASRLTAVQDGRVFYGGLTYQGPIIHLFQLETAARGLFPDTFDAEEELFDRDRVSAIVRGEF